MSDPNPTTPETPRGKGASPNEPTPRLKWGAGKARAKADWTNLRDLVGYEFVLTRTYEASASKDKKFVFEIAPTSEPRADPTLKPYTATGTAFSVRIEGSTVGDQIARDGLPPTGFRYTVDRADSTGSPQGYSLSLRQL